MKAPKYQRMEALEAAVQAAGHELADPVEGLEVTHEGIVAWAGGRYILLNSRWIQTYAESGEPALGSGHWSADYIRDCDAAFRGHDQGRTRRPWRLW